MVLTADSFGQTLPKNIYMLLLLMLKISISPLPPSVHLVITIARTVSPSAVWYTSLGFVRSGMIHLPSSSSRYLGEREYMWSRSASFYNDTWKNQARTLDVHITSINPSGDNLRWHGFPVRCLVYKLAIFRWRNYKPQLPLNFGQGIRPKGDNVRSGYVTFKYVLPESLGKWGYLRSHIAASYTSKTHATAFLLYFNDRGLDLSHYLDRYLGFPVRCLIYKFNLRP